MKNSFWKGKSVVSTILLMSIISIGALLGCIYFLGTSFQQTQRLSETHFKTLDESEV
jgi:uncharacterized membrane protein